MWQTFVTYSPGQEGCYLDDELDELLNRKHVAEHYDPEKDERSVEWEYKTRSGALGAAEKLSTVRWRGEFHITLSREPS